MIVTNCLPSTSYVIGRGVDLHRPEAALPQQRAGARVERLEIAFAAAGEQQIGRGRQDAAVGEVVHRERPLALAGRRIDRDDGAVARRVGPRVDRTAPDVRRHRRVGHGPRRPIAAAHERAARLILGGLAREHAGDVLPGGNVEEPGPRAVRRRVPVRAALLPGPDRRAGRLRRLDRPALARRARSPSSP